MTGPFVDELRVVEAPPSALDRGRSLRRYMARRPSGDLVSFLRSEADEDPAALLVAVSLGLGASLRRAAVAPVPTWLALALAVWVGRR